jgi:hypothetical protein
VLAAAPGGTAPGLRIPFRDGPPGDRARCLVLTLPAVGTVPVARPTLGVEVVHRPLLAALRADLDPAPNSFGGGVLGSLEVGVDRAEQ